MLYQEPAVLLMGPWLIAILQLENILGKNYTDYLNHFATVQPLPFKFRYGTPVLGSLRNMAE